MGNRRNPMEKTQTDSSIHPIFLFLGKVNKRSQSTQCFLPVVREESLMQEVGVKE